MAEAIKKVVNKVEGETFSVPFVINGEEHYPEKSFDVTNPATGKVVHKGGAASEADAFAAVDAAAKAFKTWRNTIPRERRDIFLKAGEIMQGRREELARYMMDETGCTRSWADFNLDVARDFIIDVAGRIATLVGMIPATQDENTGAYVLKEPFGVVLAIAPWYARICRHSCCGDNSTSAN